jgi:acrylyl-CoA reductase (NADPH)
VGSVAIALLDKLGYRVVASSRRAEQEAEYFRGLGADEIIDAGDLAGAGKSLGKERWAGAIDSLGSQTLANVLSQIRYDGAVAACGLAQGPDLPTTVMPFILRGVTLAGIDSVLLPINKRRELWQSIASDLLPRHLDDITRDVSIREAPDTVRTIIGGGVTGRTRVVVKDGF